MITIPIVCCSKGRSHQVFTMDNLPHERVTLVVPWGEGQAYAHTYPNASVVETPRSINNLSKTRQYVLHNFPNVFMIDDDVKSVVRNWENDPKHSRVDSPDTVYDVIQQVGNMALDMGAYMFSFESIRNPLQFISHEPFKMSGYMNASYTGFLAGHGLEYDPDLWEGEDHYMSLLNAYVHRYCLIDCRYSFHTYKNWELAGGLSGIRTQQNMEKSTIILRKKFGEAVIPKLPSKLKGKVIKGERSLRFPF